MQAPRVAVDWAPVALVLMDALIARDQFRLSKDGELDYPEIVTHFREILSGLQAADRQPPQSMPKPIGLRG